MVAHYDAENDLKGYADGEDENDVCGHLMDLYCIRAEHTFSSAFMITNGYFEVVQYRNDKTLQFFVMVHEGLYNDFFHDSCDHYKPE